MESPNVQKAHNQAARTTAMFHILRDQASRLERLQRLVEQMQAQLVKMGAEVPHDAAVEDTACSK